MIRMHVWQARLKMHRCKEFLYGNGKGKGSDVEIEAYHH
jgi:hypothetical protein